MPSDDPLSPFNADRPAVDPGDAPDVFPPAPGCRLETVVINRPRCPRCDSPSLRNNGTIDQGDGTQLRYVVCRGCNARFKLVLQ